MTSVKNLNKAISKVLDDVQGTTVDKVYIFVKDYVSDEKAFVAAFEEFKKTLKQDFVFPSESGKAKVVQKRQRVPSPYNQFIGKKISELKKENPEKDGKELMKLAIESWKATDKSTLTLPPVVPPQTAPPV